MYTRIIPTGDCALQVEFENEISIPVNAEVVQLRTFLEERGLPGVKETLQSYRSLMIHYDPEVIRYEELKQKLEEVFGDFEADTAASEGGIPLVTEIPVYYGGEWGPDLEEVAEKEGISTDEVIRRHSTNLNYVYMIAFSPGLCYVGNPDDTFQVPRRENPRTNLPRGSVTIWKNQTTVFPTVMPGGWNVIGRTPLRIFDMEKKPAFLLQSGQWVKFVPITKEEFDRIDQEIENGTYEVVSYVKE